MIQWTVLFNIAKTKELVLAFTKQRSHTNLVSIKGTEVDTVKDYRYLGVHIDVKIDSVGSVQEGSEPPVFSLRCLPV